MSRALRLSLLIAGAAAVGVATGFIMRWGNDLALAQTPHPERLPHLPGAALPARRSVGWSLPSARTPEGRLMDRLMQSPGDFTREDLFRHLGAPHPAVRSEAAKVLGRRWKGSKDAEILKALEARIGVERDPVARSAMKSALDEVAGR